MEHKKIKLGITHGDINGIGYEVILKTFSDSRMLEFCTPVLYGSSKVATYHKNLLSLHQDISINTVASADAATEKHFNVVNLTDEEIKIDIGRSTEVAGELSHQQEEHPVANFRLSRTH